MPPTALVTGGAIRVGRAISLGLAESGYDIVLHYRSSEGPAREVEAMISELGRRVWLVRGDLSQADEAVRVAGEVAEHCDRLDVLVNSASVYYSDHLQSVTTEDWDHVMAVNVRAPFLLVRELGSLLEASRGSVVNITDLSAFQPWTTYPHHSVSKAALMQLTRVQAKTLAPNVRVNAIAPGNVLPPEDHGEKEIARSVAVTPLGRIGQPEDVVQAVLYLTSAAYVTGEVIVVDGGRLLV